MLNTESTNPRNVMKLLDIIAKILVIIGALNWGLYGAFNMDLVAKLLGNMTMPARVVYIVIGVAGLYCIIFCKAMYHRCCEKH